MRSVRRIGATDYFKTSDSVDLSSELTMHVWGNQFFAHAKINSKFRNAKVNEFRTSVYARPGFSTVEESSAIAEFSIRLESVREQLYLRVPFIKKMVYGIQF